MATIFLYGYEAVQEGTVRLLRIKLAHSIVLVPGDRFVLRQPLPAGTIGGGRVLDTFPEPRQRKATTFAWLEQLRISSLAQQIALRVCRRKVNGINLEALSAETGLTSDTIRRYVNAALQSGDLLLIGGDLFLSREAFLAAANAIAARLKNGQLVRSSELRSQQALSAEVFDFVVESLVRENRIQISEDMISIYGAGPPESEDESNRMASIAQAYEAAGLVAPSVMELAQRFSLNETDLRRLITALQRSKTIVRMGSDELFIHSEPLKQLAAQVIALRGSLMDVARFKQLTGLSRKYAIPLLEYLDRQRITRKQGDQRLIL